MGHLVENERGMSIHVYKVRQGRETVPGSFDLEEWNAGLKERMGTVTPSDVLQQMAEVRAKTLAELGKIKDEEWGLTGRHPDQGTITIAQYYETIAGHDAHHYADIKQALGL
jgi:hypothetical protein